MIAEIANGSYQWFDLSRPGNENKSWDYKGSIASGITEMLAPGRSIQQNVGIAVGGAVSGGLIGGGIGKYAPGLLSPIFGNSAGFWSDVGGAYVSEDTGSAVKDAINKLENNK